MNNALSQEELEAMLDNAVREVTKQSAGVQLYHSGEELGEDLCTVHVTFNRGVHTSLSLCADTALLSRMAKNVYGVDTLTPQDLEDFGKEYFNILCGKIVAYLFQTTKVAARFGVPTFHRGRYTPEDQRMQFVLTYADEHQGGVQFIHHIPGTI